ncbi:hypothetical protein [Roseomonas xinghualingensis]|uniref:hypothetical protein n=1 Tax=Roseomonas xinghualingensis TaxID=2986475 RepID=UPI00367054BF
MRQTLLGLSLSGLLVLPAMAQGWPGESGPNGDHLGLTMRQFDRLGPPPIEAGMGERQVPDLTVTDLPAVTVYTGTPVLDLPPVASPAPPPRAPRHEARRRGQDSQPPRTARSSIREESRLDRLERELAERGRQIEQLQQQIAQDRQLALDPRSTGARASGSLLSISPAAVAPH